MYEEARPFWNGLKEHKLRIQRCTECDRYIFYPRTYCPHDLGELVYEEVEASGKIIAYSVVERCGEPSLMPYLPYVAALIELDCGPKMFARLVDTPVPVQEVLYEKKVKGQFEKQGDLDIVVFKVD